MLSYKFPMTIKPGTPLDDAIAAAGGVAHLGNVLGVAHTSVVKWRKSGRIPASRVVAIEAATGVSRHRLRPDLYRTASNSGLAETQAAFTPEAQAPFAAEAQALGLDAATIAARAVQEAIRAEKARRWLAENAGAIEAWNRWTESNELPLAEYRMF